MYNDVRIGKKRRDNQKKIKGMKQSHEWEKESEKDYFTKINEPEPEPSEEVVENSVQSEGEEVYNKIRAWREITDKEEPRVEDDILSEKSEDSTEDTEDDDNEVEYEAEVDIQDDRSEENMLEKYNLYLNDESNFEPEEFEGLESVFLGTVVSKNDLETDAVKDILKTQVYDSDNKVGYIWVVEESAMYYHDGDIWVKEETIEQEEENEKGTITTEADEPYQFEYEPDTEEDEGDDLGYNSLISEAGEGISDEQIESLDGVDDLNMVEVIFDDVLAELAKRSKSIKDQLEDEQEEENEEVEEQVADVPFFDEDDDGIDEVEENDEIVEAYVDVEPEDFIWDEEETEEISENIDFKEELENDTEEYADSEVEEAFEDPYYEDDDYYDLEDLAEYEEAFEDPYFEDDEGDEVEIWDLDQKLLDEDENDGVWDDDVSASEITISKHEEKEPDESNAKTSLEYTVIEDEIDRDIVLTSVKESNKNIPIGIVKYFENNSPMIINLESFTENGFSISDFLVIAKYLMKQLAKECEPQTEEEKEMTKQVILKISEAQMWLDAWSNQ